MLSHLQSRVTLILNILGELVVSVTPLSVNFNSFKLKILLKDDSSLRLNEQYRGNNLEKYAYYWLDAQSNLIIGWDNAPHHLHLSSHPHHKHIAKQTDIHPSTETDLDAVLDVIRGELSADR